MVVNGKHRAFCNMTLEFDGIQFKYDENPLLSGIYVRCERGKITGLLGRNGSGKSTLLKIVFGSLESEVKSIRINNVYIRHPAFSERVISYLPQESFIPNYLTLRQILRLYKIKEELIVASFAELMDNINKKKDQLAGGTIRIFENLLILYSPSQFSFFDEPFTGLSPVMIEKLLECFEREKRNKGMLVTDHQYRHVMGISDDLFLLLNGKTYFMRNEKDLIQRGYLIH